METWELALEFSAYVRAKNNRNYAMVSGELSATIATMLIELSIYFPDAYEYFSKQLIEKMGETKCGNG